MTKSEARKIIAVLMVTYPNYNPVDTDLAVKVWLDSLGDCSYELVDMALKTYITSSTSGFAPTPGQIISLIQQTRTPEHLNPLEAWSLVRKALANSGYNSVSEFAKLPELVQRAVGQASQLRAWALEDKFNEEVAMSNFIKVYKNEVVREENLSKMPQQFRQAIKNANVGSHKAQIEEKRQQAVKLAEDREKLKLEDFEKAEGVPFPDRLKGKLEKLEKHNQTREES